MCKFVHKYLRFNLFIFSRLTTNQTNPLIFSINADSQWVNCSPNETNKPFGEH